MEMRFVCQFHCHGANHEFVLPHRSPLGKSVGERYQATDRWPIDFLCWQHEQMCLVAASTIRLDTVLALPLGLQLASLWQIAVECANKNCAQRRTIYIKYSADETPSAVVRLLLSKVPLVDCPDGHFLQFDASRMVAERLGP